MSNFESEQCKFEFNNISALSFWPTTYSEKKLEAFLSKKLERDIHEIIPDREQSNQMQIGENMNKISDIFSPNYGKNILNLEEEINLDDLYFINLNKTKTISSIELQAFYLFTNPIKKLEEIYKVKKYNFPKTKRSKNADKHYQRNSNHYVRINTRFFNTHLIKALNKKLKKNGYNKSFTKFSQDFVKKIEKRFINKVMNFSLIQLFLDREIYSVNDRKNYENNLEIIRKIQREGNTALNTILNFKIKFLFEEYLNSQEFIDEINYQKRPNIKRPKNEYDIEKFIYLAKIFVKYGAEVNLLNNFEDYNYN